MLYISVAKSKQHMQFHKCKLDLRPRLFDCSLSTCMSFCAYGPHTSIESRRQRRLSMEHAYHMRRRSCNNKGIGQLRQFDASKPMPSTYKGVNPNRRVCPLYVIDRRCFDTSSTYSIHDYHTCVLTHKLNDHTDNHSPACFACTLHDNMTVYHVRHALQIEQIQANTKYHVISYFGFMEYPAKKRVIPKLASMYLCVMTATHYTIYRGEYMAMFLIYGI